MLIGFFVEIEQACGLGLTADDYRPLIASADRDFAMACAPRGVRSTVLAIHRHHYEQVSGHSIACMLALSRRDARLTAASAANKLRS
jgi:hypothetical protein